MTWTPNGMTGVAWRKDEPPSDERPANISAQHERFALAYAERRNAAAAYREVYGTEDGGRGYLLLRRPEIKARIEDIDRWAAAKSGFTVLQALTELEEARQLALQIEQPGAAVSATMGKAKLTGLEPERAQKHELSGPGGGAMDMAIRVIYGAGETIDGEAEDVSDD